MSERKLVHQLPVTHAERSRLGGNSHEQRPHSSLDSLPPARRQIKTYISD